MHDNAGEYVFLYQVLLHAANEAPMMAERSFAVSPGLYSLVTIDRTEV